MKPLALSERLEEYDFLRVARELSTYGQAGANRLSLVLPATATLFGSFVSVRVEIQPKELSHLPPDKSVALMEAWIDWPPSRSGSHFNRRGISVTEFNATTGDETIIGVETQTLGDKTTFLLPPGVVGKLTQPLVLELLTPSVYFLLPGRAPFARNLLNLNLSLLVGADKTVMYLDNPAEISLRARVDNSDYHSLAYAAEGGLIRKISFFSDRYIKIRYFWGVNNSGHLISPSVPLYASGISLIAAAFTLALVQAQLSDLASAVLAFALLPPFFQLLSQRRLMFPSADILRMSVDDLMALIAVVLYLPLIVVTGLSLTFFPSLRPFVQTVNLGVGVAFLLGAGAYLFLLHNGFFQYYACDVCERRIRWRRNAHLHIPTRRTLCEHCWQAQLTTEAAESTKTTPVPPGT